MTSGTFGTGCPGAGCRGAAALRPALAAVLGRAGRGALAGRPLGSGRLDLVRLRGDGAVGELEAELRRRALAHHDDADVATILEPAEEHLVRQRRLDELLDDAAHGTGAHLLVVAAIHQPAGRLVGQADGDVPVGELRLQLKDELLHHQTDDLGREVGEGDHRIETIAEFRREGAVDRLHVIAFPLVAG